MKKLKTLFHSNYFYIILLLSLSIYFFIFYNRKVNTKINLEDTNFIGIIKSYKIDKDLLTLEIKGKEKIIAYYYFKSEEEMLSFPNQYKLGDKLFLEGSFSLPKNNTVPNLFNYKKHLKYRYIYIIMNATSITKIENNKNIFYFLKNSINTHINKYKSKAYLETFILGNKTMLDNEVISNYQENGISHLLAISGMHISLLSTFLLSILKKLKLSLEKCLIITCLFLFFYMFLTGATASVSRSVLLFTLLALNKLLKLEIKTIKVFLLTFIILLFINPYFLFDIGFIFSFTISFYLILFQDKLKTDSYIKSLFKISLISFLVSLPITLYNFYEINFLSIILNIFYVPFVSMIVFPLSLLTFLFPFLDSIFLLTTNLLELLSGFTSNLTFFNIIFGKVNYLFIIFYYLFITLLLMSNKKKYLVFIILLLLVQYNKNLIFPKDYFIMIDVQQGDSLLIHSHNKTMLLDTGGKIPYPKESWQKTSKNLSETTLIPLLKSLGIKKLDYLCFSHGDYDHLGEASNLIKNFKVNTILFNSGKINSNEEKVINLAKDKNIKYKKVMEKEKITLGNFKFLELNKEFIDENDSSTIFLVSINKYYMLLTGDASKKSEEYILSNYNLPEIDFLKVGHHGSKTSTSIQLLDRIKPKIALISVGLNNRYNHPSLETIDSLNKRNITTYLTSTFGSIEIKFNNNYKIYNYVP